MSYMDFSSWPREQEQTFVVYEQHTSESLRKGLMFGIVAALAFFVITVGIYAGVAPDTRDVTKGMNMDNLTKRSKKPAAEAPAPPKQEAPAAAPEAPKAEAPKAEGAAPAAEKPAAEKPADKK
jgi:hypothetical protein